MQAKVIIVSVRILYVSLHMLKSFLVGGGGWMVHKVIVVSVRVLCVSLHRLKSFPVVVVVGGPQTCSCR